MSIEISDLTEAKNVNVRSCQEYEDLVEIIIKASATPVIVCSCGWKIWCYEFSMQYIYDRFLNAPCQRCGAVEKKMLADFNAPEL